MAEMTKNVAVERRTITTYRWICTNKELCEQIDEQIARVMGAQSHLSGYVANKEITGLQCIALDSKFKYILDSLKKERKTLWRRVRREEVIETEVVPDNVEVNNASDLHI